MEEETYEENIARRTANRDARLKKYSTEKLICEDYDQQRVDQECCWTIIGEETLIATKYGSFGEEQIIKYEIYKDTHKDWRNGEIEEDYFVVIPLYKYRK